MRKLSPAWDSAVEQFADRVEEVIVRPALAGWTEPVYQGGKQVGTRQRYDGRLLLELVRSLRPAKWGRTATVELSGPGGSAIALAATTDDPAGLTRVDLAEAQILLRTLMESSQCDDALR